MGLLEGKCCQSLGCSFELLRYFLSAECGEDEEEDENLMALTPKRRRLCSQLGLGIGSCSPFTGMNHVVYCSNFVLAVGLLCTWEIILVGTSYISKGLQQVSLVA